MRFLAPVFLLVLLLLAACGDGEAAPSPPPTLSPTATRTPRATPSPTVTPSPSPSPTPTPTPSPTPAPTPTPYAGAIIDLGGSHSRQGGFLTVRLLYPPQLAGDPAVVFTGLTHPMAFAADHWYSYIGLPTGLPIGGYPLDIYSGGVVIASTSLDVTEGGFEFLDLNLPPGSAGDLLHDQARIDAERAEVNAIIAGYTPERHFSGAWITPAQGNISDAFGTQRSINGGAYFPHSGLDIANETGTPIYAAASGYAALAKELYLYGNSVIIDHGVGVFSSYNHMNQVAVTKGQFVNQGDLIGYMGATGFVTGPHVHWEAIVHSVRVDPSLWTLGGTEP